VLWLVLFIVIGLPSACVGSCFLMMTTGSSAHIDWTFPLIGVGGILLFVGLLVLMIQSFRKRN